MQQLVIIGHINNIVQMDIKVRFRINKFVYTYQTLDPKLIVKNLPGITIRDAKQVIKRDFMK